MEFSPATDMSKMTVCRERSLKKAHFTSESKPNVFSHPTEKKEAAGITQGDKGISASPSMSLPFPKQQLPAEHKLVNRLLKHFM